MKKVVKYNLVEENKTVNTVEVEEITYSIEHLNAKREAMIDEASEAINLVLNNSYEGVNALTDALEDTLESKNKWPLGVRPIARRLLKALNSEEGITTLELKSRLTFLYRLLTWEWRQVSKPAAYITEYIKTVLSK